MVTGAGFHSFTMLSPAQADEHRVYELALLQLRGFFFRLTYDEGQRTGFWWPGGYHPINYSPRSNWGNSLQRSFMSAVEKWEPRLLCSRLANGFFGVAVRKHPEEACWSWALEWNCNLRTIGFFGSLEVAEKLVASFTRPVSHVVAEEPGVVHRMGQEVPLSEADDCLFRWAGELLDPETA